MTDVKPDLKKLEDAAKKIADGLVELAESFPSHRFRSDLLLPEIDNYWLNAVVNSNMANYEEVPKIIGAQLRAARSKIRVLTYGRDYSH